MANLSYIEEYLKVLEEEQMGVVDAVHADPLSAEEGRRQAYSADPRLQQYKRRQAQGKLLKGGFPEDFVGFPGFGFSPSGVKKAYQDWDLGKDISEIIGSSQRAAGELFGNEELLRKAEEEKRLRDIYEQVEPRVSDESLALSTPLVDVTSSELASLGKSRAPMMAAAAAASAGTLGLGALGSSLLGVGAGMTPTVFGPEYEKARLEKGFAPEQAAQEAGLRTAYEAIPELLPFAKAFGPVGRSILSRILQTSGAEAVSEVATEWLNISHDYIKEGITPTIEDVIRRSSLAATFGFGIGAGLGGIGAIRDPYAQRGAPSDIPPEPDITQTQTPSVAPIAPGELSDMTLASQAPEDPSRRRFLQNMRDIATVATTTPSDLLPTVPEITQQVESQAPVPAPSVGIDFQNSPLPSRYKFVVNGKDLFVDAPDASEISDGNLSILVEDSGDVVDIEPYLDLSKDISQKDIDAAVARAVKDNLISAEDEVTFGGAERDYDEAGNNAEPATFGEIERFESQNNPKEEFDKVFGVVKELPETKRPLSTYKDLVSQIPELPELNRQLAAARDRLKSLEAGIPPEGFEDVYTEKDIKEDIQLEKDSIKLLEEEIAIKKEEPIEGEVSEKTVESIDPFNIEQYYIPYNEDAPEVSANKKSGKRDVSFSGKNYIEGLDIQKIVDKTNISGKVSGSGKINVVFVYAKPGDGGRIIASDTSDALTISAVSSYGTATYAEPGLPYEVRINLAKFDEAGIADILDTQAQRMGISVEELTRRIQANGENLVEYAVRSVLQHEITHVNHFEWEYKALGGRGGKDPLVENVRSFRRELYKRYRKEIIEFLNKNENNYSRIGLRSKVNSNKEAIDYLDDLFAASTGSVVDIKSEFEAGSQFWRTFSELLAYTSEYKNIETWVDKFKRIVKLILQKMGFNIQSDELKDLIDDMYTSGNINKDLPASRIARGDIPPIEEERLVDINAAMVQRSLEGRLKTKGSKEIPNKLDKTISILENNKVPDRIINKVKANVSKIEKTLGSDILQRVLSEDLYLSYDQNFLSRRLEQLREEDIDTYNELIAHIESTDLLINIEVDEITRDDIPVGNAIDEISNRVRNILGNESNEDYYQDYNDDTWLQAWAEPPKKKKPKTDNDVFEDAINNQTRVDPKNKEEFNSTGAEYISPLTQEVTESDNKAQQEYTGGEVTRPKARERTTLRALWGWMYSQASQTVRRHSGSSKTAGLIADMVLRAPHYRLREKETQAGRDYVQKKSMAMGEFRLDFQRALDELTNNRGVIPLKVNTALTEFFNTGKIPSNAKVARAAQALKESVEKLYAWSEKVGRKYTEDFSLRPKDGGVFPRVYNTDKVASAQGRKRLMDLLRSIGIVDDPANNVYDATDAYNIILESGGFVSGDFTTAARDSQSSMQRQQELFERIENEISRESLGDLLVTDYQGIIPRFIDKAVEMSVFAEIFGHRREHLNELKGKVKQEIDQHNRNNPRTLINSEEVIGDINDLIDILHHRYKANEVPTGGRKVLQAAMNATTMASLTLVSLASMPEFLTATMLGSRNPAKFVSNFMGAATFAVLRGMNGVHKLLTGKMMKGYFDPKTKAGNRAKFLRDLGLFDVSSLGEAAATRYVGPSFIKSGVGSTSSSFSVETLYKLYGLGNLEKGRFRARQLRAAANMDVYFELTLLTTLTQMQQMMALKNLQQTILSDAKTLSKAKKGKGFKLESTIAQVKSNLKSLGLSNSEINELVRWYDAGHRELYDVPREFKLDLAGPAHRFVQTVITLPSEGSLPKIFRDPRFAPFLLFKSFITTFGNTFLNTTIQRLRFAEGKGVEKKYQQAKQVAGMAATATAMYAAVQAALMIGYLIKYGDDENPWEDKIPEWTKFIQDFERTGLFGPLGSAVVQVATPNYWSWQGKDPWDELVNYIIGPIGKQISNIGQTVADVAQGKDLDLEARIARAIPLTKSEPLREAVGAKPYYTTDDKGKMVRRRTLEKREEKKAAKKEAQKQELLDSITDRAAKELKLSKEEIAGLSRSELDRYIQKNFGFNPDGRRSKASMINQFLETRGAKEEDFLKSEESEAYKKRQEELQSVRDEAKDRVRSMSKEDLRKEALKLRGMTKKEVDEYVELEYGIMLDARKSKDAMARQFNSIIKEWIK